ncbi:hypothetical protein CQW23_09678 [Capsicum baccatum]|uniref:F-box associated beta-propeller type 1 domain-containing protein n=1 Tax=Capsicum baccatum TaxID=33114 RepID=A0A2G2WXK6_CAPBA|nr:hypothetical protein CQW23_09678 [Capsicum baccatum]
MKNYNVLCSLDGLLLLKNEHMNFVLWNPSTRQHQDLESCPYLNNYARPHASGLCYDDFTTDAYKVILIYGLFYVVYSTSTHSWTIKQHLLGLPASFELLRSYFWNRGISRGTSIEGCVYWSLPWKLKENGGKTSIIICFDVKSDELKELPSPDLYNDRWLLTSTLKGCLVLYNVNYSTMKSNIWIIEQDGWRLLTQPICDVQPLSLEEHFIVLEAALCLMGNDELIFYRSRLILKLQLWEFSLNRHSPNMNWWGPTCNPIWKGINTVPEFWSSGIAPNNSASLMGNRHPCTRSVLAPTPN